MVKNYLGLFVLLTTGVVVGMLWSQPKEPAGTNVAPITLPADQQSPARLQRTANLEAEIIQLKQRLERLEREVHQRASPFPRMRSPPMPCRQKITNFRLSFQGALLFLLSMA